MTSRKRYSPEENRDKFNRLSPNVRLVEKFDPTDPRRIYKLQCTKCGHSFRKGSLLKRQARCPECYPSQGVTLTHNTFLQLAAKVDPNLKVISKYVNSGTAVKVRCRLCDHEFSCGPQKLMYGFRNSKTTNCPKCGKNPLRFNHKEFIKRVSHRKDIKVIGEYTGVGNRIKVKSTICGHVFNENPQKLLYSTKTRPYGCRECAKGVAARKPMDEVLESIRLSKPHIDLLGTYTDMGTSTIWKCNICNVKFSASPGAVLHQKYTCPKCVQQSSGYERTKIILGGKVFSLQGWEPIVLRDLVKIKGLEPKEILCGRDVPIVPYGARQYHPDFYLPNYNRLIEVKSTYTLLGQRSWFKTMVDKYTASVNLDYNFTLYVLGKGKRYIKFPRNWYTLPYKNLKRVYLRG